MATTVTTSKTQPAVVLDKIHIDSFTFKQVREDNPKRQVGMSFCLYGTCPEGDRVFDNETVGVSDTDMDTTVATAAVTAGQTLEDFMSEYEAEKLALTNAYNAGTIKDTTIMAYFELAMARVAELNGKIAIASVG